MKIEQNYPLTKNKDFVTDDIGNLRELILKELI